MSESETPPYAVQFQPFSEVISIGRLNKARDLFLGNQYEATEMVMYAVKEYIGAKGDTAFTYSDGTQLELRLKKVDDMEDKPKTTEIRVDELKVGDKVFTSAGGLDVTKIEAKESGTYYFWIKNPRPDREDMINAWNGDWEIEILDRGTDGN